MWTTAGGLLLGKWTPPPTLSAPTCTTGSSSPPSGTPPSTSRLVGAHYRHRSRSWWRPLIQVSLPDLADDQRMKTTS